MYKIIFRALLLFSLMLLSLAIDAQVRSKNWEYIGFPSIGIKSNLLYDATGTLNLGAEMKISDRYTIDMSGNINGWSAQSTRLMHILIQPELRYWKNEPFKGQFIGFHALYSNFSVGKVSLPFGFISNLKTDYYQGNLFGGGVSYGYQFYLGPRWNIEATIGAGYAFMKYDRLQAVDNYYKLIESKTKHYFGPTKIGVSLVYFIK